MGVSPAETNGHFCKHPKKTLRMKAIIEQEIQQRCQRQAANSSEHHAHSVMIAQNS